MIDLVKNCKQLTTSGEVEVEVHASHNDTGRVYLRGMHGGRNDQMRWC